MHKNTYILLGNAYLCKQQPPKYQPTISQCIFRRSIALPTHRKRTAINNIHLRSSKTTARAGTSNMLRHCGTETLDKTTAETATAGTATEMPIKPVKQSDSQPDKRIKPVVPAKPAFIPPPPTGRQPHHRTPSVLNDNPVVAPAVPAPNVPGFVVPSSPNIGCGSSDCCGILSGGTAKQNDNQSPHPPANNNNNNNNNSNQNNNRNGAGASVDQPDHAVGHSDAERRWCRSASEQDRTCAQLDAIKKKTMDLDSRLPHKFYEGRGAVPSPASTSAAAPPNRNNVQNKFFQQSSKQLEQLLAQRIEKETLVAAAAAGKTNKKRFGVSVPAPMVAAQAASTSNAVAAESTAISTIQKQIQHKLHDEMKKHCKTIQEKHLIEKRGPQQAYRPSTGADCDPQMTVSGSFTGIFPTVTLSSGFIGSPISSCYHWIENSTEIKGKLDMIAVAKC